MGPLESDQIHIPMNIADGLRVSTYRYPNKIAVVQGEHRVTFRELNRRANRLANALLGLGLKRGDGVGVLLANIPEYIEILFGLAKAGLTLVPISYRLLGSDVSYQLNHSDARMLIIGSEYLEIVEVVSSDLSGIRHTAVVGEIVPTGFSSYEDILLRANDSECSCSAPETTPFFIGYTSGTTGRPKGAVVSHRSRVLTMLGMAAEYGCYTPEDTTLAVAPIYHGAGMVFALAAVYFGGTASILRTFDPEEVVRRLADDHVTNVFLVPTMFHAIFKLKETTRRRFDHSALRVIMSNAAPLPQASKERIVEEWPQAGLHELYGSTEGGIVTSLRPADQLRKISCVGQPFPMTDIQLLDDAGKEVPTGKVGELYSRSPYLLNCYHKDSEATSAGFRDGYFTVGDLAVRDEENYFYIVDRKKDMIVTGGVNVYPREVEEVLFRHPKIADVAVIGVSDPYWGETIKAVAVLQTGVAATVEEIMAFCDGKLARFKHPRSVDFVEQLPRNAAGKVLKRALRERYGAEGSQKS